jgi:modulator of drug activity B
MKILIINTHLTYPGWSEGKLNLAFMDLAKAFFVERGHQVAETFVERGYDPEEEVKKHVAVDLVILQTPVNWFSAPWIYKKYVDEVFNVGLAKEVLLAGDGRTRQDPSRQYGTGGKMQGKKFMISATWNAPSEAFDNPNGELYGGKGTADLFLHITSNYKFMGFDILPDYGVFDIFKNPDIARACRLQAAFRETLPVSLHHYEHMLTQSTTPFRAPKLPLSASDLASFASYTPQIPRQVK